MKDKTLHIIVIAAIAVGLFFLIERCTNTPKYCTEHLCGGYTEQHELTDEDMKLFQNVMGESVFTPLSVATQVVAGLNYRFWCRYDDGSENAPGHCFITIYQPLQGEPVLSGIKYDWIKSKN